MHTAFIAGLHTLNKFDTTIDKASEVVANIKQHLNNPGLDIQSFQQRQQQLQQARNDVTTSVIRRYNHQGSQESRIIPMAVHGMIQQQQQHYIPNNQVNMDFSIARRRPQVDQNVNQSGGPGLGGLGSMFAGALGGFGQNVISQKIQDVRKAQQQKTNAKKMSDTIQNLKTAGKYKIGDFSNFAQQVQGQLIQKRQIIDLVVRQAVISYKNKLLQNQNNLKKLLHIQTLGADITNYFDNQNKLKQYVRNPLQYQQDYYRKASWNIVRMQTIAEQMIQKRNYIRKLAVADGKFLQVQRLKLQNRFYIGQSLYLSTDMSNLFVKIQKTKQPVKVILFNGKFYQKQQLNGLTQQMKLQILGMIILFLKHNNILLDNSQIKSVTSKVGELIQQVKRFRP